MFAESGRTREALWPMTAAFEQWLSPRLEDGSYFGWMLEDAGVVIAGLGMMVIDWRLYVPQDIHFLMKLYEPQQLLDAVLR
jgi:hypothetical protein